MSYVIEEGVPVPEPRRSKVGAPKHARTEWTMTLDKLRPGQCTTTDKFEDYKSAQHFTLRRPDREFAIRKIPRVGWRVWRLQ